MRAALEWSFSPRGEIGVGTALVAAAAPLFCEVGVHLIYVPREAPETGCVLLKNHEHVLRKNMTGFRFLLREKWSLFS